MQTGGYPTKTALKKKLETPHHFHTPGLLGQQVLRSLNHAIWKSQTRNTKNKQEIKDHLPSFDPSSITKAAGFEQLSKHTQACSRTTGIFRSLLESMAWCLPLFQYASSSSILSLQSSFILLASFTPEDHVLS